MTDEDAFLKAICDQPDEDMPRLAFADWLDERGGDVNAAWAELIRVQVSLARGAGADREQLAARERDLSPVVAAAWPTRLGFPDGLYWQNWSRGFPLAVSARGAFVRAARPVFAGRIPLREFSLKGATDAGLLEFVTWPELALVRKLGVWTDAAPVTGRGLRALTGCEHLSNLERLQMQWVVLTDAAVAAFLDSPHMARVISLRLKGDGLPRVSEGVRQRFSERFGEWDIL
jgi:uncharacterized protein (TIGR02996 family)